MPLRPRSHQLEDLARNRLHNAFEAVGWSVEDLRKDYGEDQFVRLFESGCVTPYSFFVQSKATDNVSRYTRRKSLESLTISLETGHLRHWLRFPEPVFVTLFDSASGNTYWAYVQELFESKDDSTLLRQGSISIRIPTANLLDEDGLLRMRGITKLRLDRIKRERHAAKFLIELIRERLGIEVEDYDPTNEFISLKDESGNGEYIFLGAAAERMDKMVQQSGMDPTEFLVKAASYFLKKERNDEEIIALRKRGREREREKERHAGRIPLL